MADDVYRIVITNAEQIQNEIDFKRDFSYDFFGFKTLEKSYLLKINGKIVERPQHMLMRVSIGIHKEDLESAFQTYHLMSQKWFTHATPTLFNAGMDSHFFIFLMYHRDTKASNVLMFFANNARGLN